MASSLLILLDDIATILDDVAVMSKVAAKKTAGVLGDDLALNAQQVSGVRSDRELPVVWKVAKGSFINKLILVPLALLISAFAPWLIPPLLILGGLFLCFEGVEKLVHSIHHPKSETVEQAKQQLQIDEAQLHDFENEKIKGAIRTDFILSAEIVVISLGTVAAASFMSQVAVLSVIAIAMTVGVYGLVAMIVKIDDAGLYLMQQKNSFKQQFGRSLLAFAPVLMKTLSIVGTLAMFLVGGGIIVHNWPWLHHIFEQFSHLAVALEHFSGVATWFISIFFNLFTGLFLGAIVLLCVKLLQQFKTKKIV